MQKYYSVLELISGKEVYSLLFIGFYYTFMPFSIRFYVAHYPLYPVFSALQCLMHLNVQC